MLLVDPPPSPADLHFKVFGIPVRVHPWFWIITLVMGLGGGREKADPANTLLWVAVVFVSILVHELGHAVLQRRYGGHPWITLYGLGGLASCDDCDRSPRSQILISLAGPTAGFLLAIVVVAALAVAGHFRGWRWDFMPIDWVPFDIAYWQENGKPSLRDAAIFYLLWVNIFWGLINLLPVYPLDGGRVARELFSIGDPRQGIIRSLWLSAITAAMVAALGLLTLGSFLMALFFGYLAYASYQTIQAYQQHWQ
jgi:membrane-associated protease RseP (regulator of RpoE activity)